MFAVNSIIHGFSLLLICGLIIEPLAEAQPPETTQPNGVIDDFNGAALDGLCWHSATKGDGSITVSKGAVSLCRKKLSDRVELLGAPQTALVPGVSSYIVGEFVLSSASQLGNKNNLYIGFADADGKNSIYLQTDGAGRWGWWVVTVTKDGVTQTSKYLSILNAFPALVLTFEIGRERVRLFGFNKSVNKNVLLFDSVQDLSSKGEMWAVPTVPLTVRIADQSSGIGTISIDRIAVRVVEGTVGGISVFENIPGNGDNSPIVIANQGKAHASIVLADTPTTSAAKAASIIQETIAESTGVMLPIAYEKSATSGPHIFVGQTQSATANGIRIRTTTEPRNQQIITRRVGRDIYIVGNDAMSFNGTVTAAYRFVNIAIGADFFYFSPNGLVIPKQTRFEIDKLAIDETPSLAYRSLYPCVPDKRQDQTIYHKWADWNYGYGLRIEHRHAHMLIAPATLFATKPYLFSEIRGKRSVSEPDGWQLCTSNPEVIERAVARSRQMLDKNPDLIAASLSINDSPMLCTCAECRKYDIPDTTSGGARRMIIFANAVAREIKKTHPGRGVAFLAYLSTLEPPAADSGLNLDDNVYVVIGESDSCLFHNLDDPSCGKNRDALRRLNGWCALTKNVIYYDYVGLYGDYMGMSFVNVKRTLSIARIISQRQGIGLTYNATYTPGSQGLHYFSAIRSAWNANITEESIFKTYCDSLYGKASAPMQKYYNRIQDACLGQGIHSSWVTWVVPGPLYIWNDNLISTLNADLTAAHQMVESGSSEALRIEDQLLVLKYAAAFLAVKRAQTDFNRDLSDVAKRVYLDLRTSYLSVYEECFLRGLISLAQSTLKAYVPEDPAWKSYLGNHSIKLKHENRPPAEDPAADDPQWTIPSQTMIWLHDENGFTAYPITQIRFSATKDRLYVLISARDVDVRHFDPRSASESGEWVRLSLVTSSQSNSSKAGKRIDITATRGGHISVEGFYDSKLISGKFATIDKPGRREWLVRLEIPLYILSDSFSKSVSCRYNVYRNSPGNKPVVSMLQPNFGGKEHLDRFHELLIGD